MNKIVLIALIAVITFGCTNETAKNQEFDKTKQVSQISNSQVGNNNYAVVWNWKTDDKQLMDSYLLSISDEMDKLWKTDIIDNIYFNSDARKESGYFPNISFFIVAKSIDDAKNTLNNLILVKKGLANYNIYPVGGLWLGRETEVIKEKGITRSFVTVWNTPNKIDPKVDGDIIVAQADALMKLWKQGVVENVYFDVEGTQSANDVTDFVFFINTKTEAEARKICNNLPFSINNKATYKIKDVGVFWLGEH